MRRLAATCVPALAALLAVSAGCAGPGTPAAADMSAGQAGAAAPPGAAKAAPSAPAVEEVPVSPPARSAEKPAGGATSRLAGSSTPAPAGAAAARPATVGPYRAPLVGGVKGRPVLGEAPLAVMAKGRQKEGIMTARLVKAVGPFARALRVATQVKAPIVYYLQVRLPSQAAVGKGDRLLLSFAVRGVKSTTELGEVQIGPCFERNGDPYTKSLNVRWRLPADGKWRRIEIPFECVEDLAAGAAMFNFRVGFEPQIIELADLRLLNYGPDVELKALPRTPPPTERKPTTPDTKPASPS